MRNYIKRVLLTVAIVIPLWFVALFLRAPVLPWIETSYYINTSNANLKDRVTITQNGNALIQLEIPDYYPESGQCIDTWFTTSNNSFQLSVSNFNLSLTTGNNNQLPLLNKYLFYDSASSETNFTVTNYAISNYILSGDNRYVFYRSVFKLSHTKNFIIHLNIAYIINGTPHSLQLNLPITKKKKLTWNRLRAH